MKLRVINTGLFKLDGGAMFGVVPKSLWNRLNPADENNMCSWAMRCLAIENNNKLLLIDNGLGNKQDGRFFSHYFLHGTDSLTQSIYNEGYTETDFTDMLLTHLHFDHCGGGVKRNGPDNFDLTFPNAKYWSQSQHWDWAIYPNAREKASFLTENILPMQQSGNLHFTDQNNSLEADFNLELILVDGHTEKMQLPLISWKGRKILFCADLFPSTGHISIPYVMAYDMRPLLTLTEKETILKRAVAENWVLFFEHDPITECATVQETDKGIRINQTFRLSEL